LEYFLRKWGKNVMVAQLIFGFSVEMTKQTGFTDKE
jgi:hypothetical protein